MVFCFYGAHNGSEAAMLYIGNFQLLLCSDLSKCGIILCGNGEVCFILKLGCMSMWWYPEKQALEDEVVNGLIDDLLVQVN